MIPISDTLPDDCMWISWTDREGAIFSSGFSFFGNLPLMLVLLLILQRFGRRQWGYISELTTKDHSVSLLAINSDGTLGGDEICIDFFPDDKVHSGRALFSRATTVLGAKSHNNEAAGEDDTDNLDYTRIKDHEDEVVGVFRGQDFGDALPVKEGTTASSGVDEKLKEEWRAFYRDRNNYRKAQASTTKSHDLVLKMSWPETSRVEEWKIIEHAHTLGEDDKFIRGHIPEVKCARDLECYSTQHIRTFLGLQGDGTPGTRTLRLIAMNRLQPIYDLDGEKFWEAFWQCVACMRSTSCLDPALTPIL